jgi:signal peptidase I
MADKVPLTRQPVLKPQPPQKSRLRQNVESSGLALHIALAGRSSVVQAFWVPSGSMLPTIQIGDHLFVNKLAYAVKLPLIGQIAKIGDPQRNDIVVFVSPADHHTDLIKRLVAVSGDTIEIRNKKLFVNGQQVDDAHASFVDPTVNPNPPRDNYGPITVPDGKVFAMGDNRDRSYDSRYWGFADVTDIKGKATFVYFSWDSDNKWPRIGRFFHYIR